MYKQSAFVIAMLMGSSAARRQAPKSVSLFATGVEDNEVLDVNVKDEDLSPEKVSILETTKAQNHTTFYGQQGEKKPADEKKIQLNGDDVPGLGLLHEKVTVLNEEYFRHRNDKKDSIFNYPEDDFERTTFYTQLKDDDLSPEKVSILETTKAQNHTTFYGQHDTKNKKKVEPVGSGNIANTHAQRKKKDIGEVGIEPNVHAFASDEVNALKNIREDEAYDLNGSGEKGWGKAFVQRKKKDIGEVGIEPNVHAFASDEVAALKHIREDEAYDLNGSGEKGWGKAFVQRKKKDIGEVGIEPNVHAFASDEVAALKHIREDEKYDLNGSADNGWGKAFVQRSIQKNMNDVKNQDIRHMNFVQVDAPVFFDQQNLLWRYE
jgi:predicted fused transcriptional regulator/phosphomethylpyrimidine kinase